MGLTSFRALARLSWEIRQAYETLTIDVEGGQMAGEDKDMATQGPGKAGGGRAKSSSAFTEEEMSSMRERAEELRSGKPSDEAAVLAKIAEMPEPDRSLAQRIHALVRAVAPELSPRLWYGMPAYAKDGKVVCFFQNASKFKARYATLGFTDAANLDDGSMWPVAFGLKELGEAEEGRIAALLRKAVS